MKVYGAHVHSLWTGWWFIGCVALLGLSHNSTFRHHQGPATTLCKALEILYLLTKGIELKHY